MRVTSCSERSAAAFELAARLDRYEADLESLAGAAGPARLGPMSRALRQLGEHSLALPQFSADLMQITMQHFELVRRLSRPELAGEPAQRAALIEQQCAAARAVRTKCLRLITRRARTRMPGCSTGPQRAATCAAGRSISKEVP